MRDGRKALGRFQVDTLLAANISAERPSASCNLTVVPPSKMHFSRPPAGDTVKGAHSRESSGQTPRGGCEQHGSRAPGVCGVRDSREGTGKTPNVPPGGGDAQHQGRHESNPSRSTSQEGAECTIKGKA